MTGRCPTCGHVMNDGPSFLEEAVQRADNRQRERVERRRRGVARDSWVARESRRRERDREDRVREHLSATPTHRLRQIANEAEEVPIKQRFLDVVDGGEVEARELARAELARREAMAAR